MKVASGHTRWGGPKGKKAP